jgi:hypothetical protein
MKSLVGCALGVELGCGVVSSLNSRQDFVLDRLEISDSKISSEIGSSVSCALEIGHGSVMGSTLGSRRGCRLDVLMFTGVDAKLGRDIVVSISKVVGTTIGLEASGGFDVDVGVLVGMDVGFRGGVNIGLAQDLNIGKAAIVDLGTLMGLNVDGDRIGGSEIGRPRDWNNGKGAI